MRNIPIITRNLLIINCMVFILSLLMKNVVDFNNVFGLHFFMSDDFHFYQLITYMFMHGGFTHLFFNMFALWMFGCVVESTLGTNRFLIFYIVCGLGAGLCQEVAQYSEFLIQGLSNYQFVTDGDIRMPMNTFLNLWTTVGASGAIYGILLAFGMLFPENRIFIFPLPVPIKAKWFIWIYVVIELFSALSTTNDGVAHVAHLGGMLFGFFLIKYWRRNPNNSHSSLFTAFCPSAKAHSSLFKRKERTQDAEIEQILDKIRKSGYESLTTIEKQKLFDHSHK